MQTKTPGRDVTDAGQFLLDRLTDFEREIWDFYTQREWNGHVVPAISRFRAALANAKEPKG